MVKKRIKGEKGSKDTERKGREIDSLSDRVRGYWFWLWSYE